MDDGDFEKVRQMQILNVEDQSASKSERAKLMHLITDKMKLDKLGFAPTKVFRNLGLLHPS